MSIISEALKKANAERDSRRIPSEAASVPARRDSRGRRWLSSVVILAVLILPFALPRLLNRPAGSMLPMADAPQETSSMSGLAQMAVESRPMPFSPQAMAAPSPFKGRKLQGIVWTQNKGYYAILDGEVVREGSLVGDFRVTRIAANGITLSDGSRDYFVEKSF